MAPLSQNAGPDPAFDFYADPDLAFHFDADSDLASQSYEYPVNNMMLSILPVTSLIV